jgi:hypothetical protein
MLRRRLVGACRVGAAAVASAFAALAFVACESPTLPLPPPALPTVGTGPDADHVRLVATCGGAEPGALMVVVNENLNVPGDKAVSGSIADGCGAWDALAYAHKGDVLDVTQELGTNASTPVRVLIQ